MDKDEIKHILWCVGKGGSQTLSIRIKVQKILEMHLPEVNEPVVALAIDGPLADFGKSKTRAIPLWGPHRTHRCDVYKMSCQCRVEIAYNCYCSKPVGQFIIGTGKWCPDHNEIWMGALEINSGIRHVITPNDLSNKENQKLISGDAAWLNAVATLLWMWQGQRYRAFFLSPETISTIAKVLAEIG